MTDKEKTALTKLYDLALRARKNVISNTSMNRRIKMAEHDLNLIAQALSMLMMIEGAKEDQDAGKN